MTRSIVLVPAPLLIALVTGCSLGQGEGEVSSDKLFAHDCLGAGDEGMIQGESYALNPDFFAAIPDRSSYRFTLQIRVQRGNDLQEVSDGLSVLIDDVAKVREALDNPPMGGIEPGGLSTCEAAQDPCPPGTVGFPVALPAGVTPPGSPTVPPQELIDNPPLVHMGLYLHKSCHNQNIVLYAVSGKICFSALFNADRNERAADEKLTQADSFKIQVGDIRDVPLGKQPWEIPCELQSTVEGNFRFYFERGQPGQPFP
jgi:hypothetical protein